MDGAVPGWEGSQRYSICHQTAAKRQVLSVGKHRGKRGRERRGFGESLPLTFRPTSLQEAQSRRGDPATPRKSTTQVEMTGVLEHVHTRWRGTEGPYGRLVLWGMSLGA